VIGVQTRAFKEKSHLECKTIGNPVDEKKEGLQSRPSQ
jgi:hypothetical protein